MQPLMHDRRTDRTTQKSYSPRGDHATYSTRQGTSRALGIHPVPHAVCNTGTFIAIISVWNRIKAVESDRRRALCPLMIVKRSPRFFTVSPQARCCDAVPMAF